MGYFVRVQMNRLDCRNADSISGADLIAIRGAIVVDGKANGFELPVRRMRAGSSEDFHQVVFDGRSEAAAIGFDVEALEDGDRLGDKAHETLPFHDVSPTERTQEFEARFRGADFTGLGLSSWNYALYFTVTHYDVGGDFGSSEQGVWQPAMKTMPAAWLGTWDGGDGRRADVTASISKGAGAGRLKVLIEEKVDGTTTETVTEGVLVSRVMIEAGGRHLDTDNPLLEKAFEAGPTFATAAPHPLERGLSDVVVTIDTGDGGPAGGIADLGDAPLLLRQQLGGDLLRLERGAVLELRQRILSGKAADLEIRYRRPVDDILYPERPALLDIPLERRLNI